MDVSFIRILFPRFLTDGLVNVLIFEVGHIRFGLGMPVAGIVVGISWSGKISGGLVMMDG